jgi:transposase
VRTGAGWRYVPHDLPPWQTVYQQTQRWLRAGVFEAIVADRRALIRLGKGTAEQSSAAICDSRMPQFTPESGGRAGYDGAKKRNGSKLHLAVATLGEFLALVVTPADDQDCAQVAELAAALQEATRDKIELADVDQGYTGEAAEQAAAGWGIRPGTLWVELVKLPEAKRGFVLLPRRWVVERIHGWLARVRRLARDYERLPQTLAGLCLVAFTTLMLARMVKPLLDESAKHALAPE